LCVCVCCCFGFFTLIVSVYCTNTHQRIKSKKDKKILAPNVGVWRRDKRGNQTADTTTC
jgi:hypothetical protein